MSMSSVRMPRTVIVLVMLCLFLAGLYGLRQYDAFGSPEHAILAAGAGAACLAIITGLIYANYEAFPASNRDTGEKPRINGSYQ